MLLILVCTTALMAQRVPDQIYMSNIKTPVLFQQNNQLSIPIIRLQSSDALELHFDDLSGVPKNYFYSFQLCNADHSLYSIVLRPLFVQHLQVLAL